MVITENEKILRMVAFFLGIIVAFLVVVVLRQLRSIMLPLFVAVFLSYLLGPVVEFLTRRRFPLWLAMLIMVVIVFSVLYLLGLILYSSSNDFIQEFPKYEARVTLMVQDVLNYFEIPLPDAKEYFETLDWKKAIQDASLPKVVSSTLGSFFNFLSKVFMVVLLSLFIIPGRRNVGKRLYRMFSEKRAKLFENVLITINSQVQMYLVVKTLISLATAGLSFLVIWSFGVDFPIMWAFIIFILNFIPTIGSIISTIPPIIVCFVQYGFGPRVFFVALILTGIQSVMGNFIEPSFMGRSLNISPLIVLLSLIFWGWLWGIPGMIIAVPITAAIKISCENIEPLKPIAVLISGK
ncbi:MAG: AI-2E family transporter [candidate division Zixibacteria bacterium]|nr:AI-2E family transporter [candidate division Zixibacteria bacterium]